MGEATEDPLGKNLWEPWKETSLPPSLGTVLGSLCVADAQGGKGLLLTRSGRQLDPFKEQSSRPCDLQEEGCMPWTVSY